jgi:hypothetical protein
MLHKCEGKSSAVDPAISDPLLDDSTILMSAALMAFRDTVSAGPRDKGGERDTLPDGGGA